MVQLRQRTDTRSCFYYVFTDLALSARTSPKIKRCATLIRYEDVFDLDEFAPDGTNGGFSPESKLDPTADLAAEDDHTS